jgi:S-adenosylmethionine hydrolase
MPGVVPLPRFESDGVHAEVLWVDRFGNCQINVGPDELASVDSAADGIVAIAIGDERRSARLASTFAELPAGAVGLVLDSQGMYALALDRRSAADELHLAQGDAVVIGSPATGGGEAAGSTSRVELRRHR